MQYFSLFPDYGHQVILQFDHKISDGAGKSSFVTAPRLHPLITMDFTKGLYYQTIQDELEAFFNAVKGSQETFLILDPSDSYASSEPTTTGLGAQTQGIVYTDGQGNWQLGKLYNIGGLYVVRPIRHTDNTREVFYSDGSPASVSVDDNTGIVTGDTQPGMTWQGNFWLAVRFENDQLPTEQIGYDPHENQNLFRFPALKLIEVREEHIENETSPQFNPYLNHTWALTFQYKTQKIFTTKTNIETIGSGYESREEYYQTSLLKFALSEHHLLSDQERIYVIALYRVACGQANQFNFNDVFSTAGLPVRIRFNSNLTLVEISKPSPQEHFFTLAPMELLEVEHYVEDANDYTENIHYYCHCWEVIRKDGLTQRFTNHDEKITITATMDTYTPIAGFSASSTQDSNQLNPNAQDLSGFVLSGVIEQDDIIAGRYDKATIKVLIVDWLKKEIIATIYKGELADYNYGLSPSQVKSFVFRSKGLTERLNKEQFLKTTATCRHKFLSQGKDACNKENTGLTLISAINTIIANTEFILADSATIYGDTKGTLQFIAGNNVGITISLSYATGTTIKLVYPPPLPVNIGDSVLLTEGCVKTLARCEELNNVENYGGQPLLTGIDNIVRNPT